VKKTYRNNVESIISAVQRRNVPILASTLVSNIKDQQPFISISDTTVPALLRGRWTSEVRRADSLMMSERWHEAVEHYTLATALDSLHAETWYKLGKALLNDGKYKEARDALTRAKDLDALRFRMSEDFQSTLLEICKSLRVPVARVDSTFEDRSPHGVIGRELILEHLHPNIEGYSLMAKTWVETIAREGLLVPVAEWDRGFDLTDEEYVNESGVTSFDEAVGRIRIAYLTGQWPFRAGEAQPAHFTVNRVDSIALRYVQKKISWQEARYEVAAYYQSRRQFEEARREAYAVSRIIPYSYEPILRIADYYLMEGKKDQASRMYLKSITVEDTPYARAKLGLVLLEQGEYEKAIENLQTAFLLHDGGRHTLPTAVVASNHYWLGYAYSQIGQVEKARNELRETLRANPDHAAARALLIRLGG
jgi:tetratricopeptide (TPR) repeat protein